MEGEGGRRMGRRSKELDGNVKSRGKLSSTSSAQHKNMSGHFLTLWISFTKRCESFVEPADSSSKTSKRGEPDESEREELSERGVQAWRC